MYILNEHPNGIEFRGGAKQLWKCKAPEVILSGPAETGKTIACLHKLDSLCWKYAGVQCVMVRKVYADIKSSVIPSYENKVLPVLSIHQNSVIRKHGGVSVQFYEYPNGSKIWIGGMDKPGKVLSSERDFAYINQAEELTIDDWETLTTRVTGRAGNSPYPQVFGDANPGPSSHWILQRNKRGTLNLFHSKHEDNPFLHDGENWTSQGVFSRERLSDLTGVRRDRLFLGKWVSAEGQIYSEYNPSIHLIDAFKIPQDWRRIRVIDFGYTNPFVCLWIALDHDDRMFVYRQIYFTGRLVSEHAKQIIEQSEE